ncbi:ret finger protein-like 4B [Molossus molossus]|uniref:ret finger protein-like 4B n=1 Tax=Molossus molossus TaxID=27622 RepID=UPI00174765E9|nr:ret finger protein-like 4B [Molossus molossus]
MWTSLHQEALCPVCLGPCSLPSSLSCVHTFCYDCTQSWVLQRPALRLICPLRREVTTKPPLEEQRLRFLSCLIEQHGFLLEQSLHMRGEFLMFREDVTLDAAAANSRLVRSDDRREVHCAKFCHQPREDPRDLPPRPVSWAPRASPVAITGRWTWERGWSGLWESAGNPLTEGGRAGFPPRFCDVRNDALIYMHPNFFLESSRPSFCPELPGEEDSGAH